jgi:hypothetical protein
MSTAEDRELVHARAGLPGVPNWVGCLFALVFALHAANYLYFFVDDEAIPYVFAQNVLDGNGLRYNSFEGRVEGYSNFLHVVASTAVLGIIRLLELDKLTVFTINKAWSLACGMALVWLTFRMLRRVPGMRAPGLVAGMSFLVLAGPLAVWSCSSLETATFALLITALVVWTVAPPSDAPAGWIVAACATAALLARVDGFVYVGTAIGSAMLVGNSRRRRDLVTRVALPSLVVFSIYQLWRIWYFGDLLPAPVVTKVLHKLRFDTDLLVKEPAENYARAFFGLYGAVPLVALCASGLAWSRGRVVMACAAAASILTAYLGLVGDWMFGFRFFLPVVPLLAVLVANSVAAIATRWRTVAGWFVALSCTVWFGAVASTFFERYVRVTKNDSWLAHPTRDPHRYFARYYSLLEESRGRLRPGDRTAYNQAGFVPFMLDLDNIDSLGLCSQFFARLPTTDLFMTEVGRYEPPTNKPVQRAGEAYVLYREPAFVMYPDDLLRRANNRRIPDALFGGYYRFAFQDSARRNVVYARSSLSVDAFKTDPRRFLENLAHVTHIRRASLNGTAVPKGSISATFPWLLERRGRVAVVRQYSADLVFADEDESVYQVFVNQLGTSAAVTVTITLIDGAGRSVYRQAWPLEPRDPRRLHVELPAPVAARRMRLDATTHTDEPVRLSLDDLRVQGQTRALAEYVRSTLRFPAP